MATKDLELETIQLEQDGRVLIARIDAPPYNFMTAQMQKDLDALTLAVDDDPSVGAVVVTGAPADRYITHFDIADILAAAQRSPGAIGAGTLRNVLRVIETAGRVPGATDLIEMSPVSGILNMHRFNEVVLRIMRSPAVYIAAVNGPCGGAGLETSVYFDVRIAADEGAGFILPELLIGLTTTIGGQRLMQLIGPGKSMEMMLEGRMYSAEEALAMGLITEVVPRDRLVEHAIEMGARYSSRNRDTIAAQKRVFNEYSLLAPADCLRKEGAANAAGIVSGPAPKALAAWVQMQEASGGDSVFLTNLELWRSGEVVDLNSDD